MVSPPQRDLAGRSRSAAGPLDETRLFPFHGLRYAAVLEGDANPGDVFALVRPGGDGIRFAVVEMVHGPALFERRSQHLRSGESAGICRAPARSVGADEPVREAARRDAGSAAYPAGGVEQEYQPLVGAGGVAVPANRYSRKRRTGESAESTQSTSNSAFRSGRADLEGYSEPRARPAVRAASSGPGLPADESAAGRT